MKLLSVFRRIRRALQPTLKQGAPPPDLLDDMSAALLQEQGGKPAAFSCPIELCVRPNGLGLGQSAWHPFTAALRELQGGVNGKYEGSKLEKYYEKWQPKTAREAVIGFEADLDGASFLPAHFLYLFPWSSRTVEETEEWLKRWYLSENRQHGYSGPDLVAHGYRQHGPMSQAVGRLEYTRLTRVYASILENGYSRLHGDISVEPLKRGGEYRFIVRGGIHRTAAMSALGYSSVPARFANPWVIDVDDVDYWPQVRAGLWAKRSAEQYLNHLFDFHSASWAVDNGFD